jgi:hypothetical protein
VYVSLAKPLDGGISIPETLGEKPYHHTGRTFEDLTIFPPVRFGHFVGIIRGGEVTFGDLALNRLAAQD